MMKKSVNNPQEETATKQCSETKCVTCFENRGCIYEQYPFAATNNLQESHIGKLNEYNNSGIPKQA